MQNASISLESALKTFISESSVILLITENAVLVKIVSVRDEPESLLEDSEIVRLLILKNLTRARAFLE
ncbi:hypothetical protein AJ78_08759 [Emergomyces pasteurianus Ep9510]|uniref:Uncharacterized protein n=1 Tax=Emergomyces pasteurianus Ep9510 TaxID=1447872 RepID=A0A1J9Q1G3_9EURO|nr:hypothetical protein AJ78_08759 [Emergomyces pasteurianus Ep9510]